MMTYYDLKYINTFKKGKNRKKNICPLLYVIHNRAVGTQAGLITQCPGTDLNKRFLPRPKTITA